MSRSAAARWATELAAWAIPAQILEAAPESPYTLSPELFRPALRPTGTVSTQTALAALDGGGSVLDVGCGAGAAGLALTPPAHSVTGVDASADMVAAFREEAQHRGVVAVGVVGTWPDVADRVDVADVVVSHHVAYNVADLPAFLRALDSHARRRVVLELTAEHPWARLAALWRHFHGTPRPTGPTAELAAEVAREVGLDAHLERSPVAPDLPAPDPGVLVAHARRQLCLPAERDSEIAAVWADLGGFPPAPRPLLTLWWEPGSG